MTREEKQQTVVPLVSVAIDEVFESLTQLVRGGIVQLGNLKSPIRQ